MQEKNADKLIESGIEALRAERAPQHATRLKTRPRPVKTLATAAVVIALVGAAVVFSPRESAAADLDKLGKAIESMPPRQEVHLVATSNGEYEVALQIMVDEDEAVLQEKDAATQVWKGNRLTTDFKDYATVQDAQKPDWTTKTFMLSNWIRQAVPNTVEKKTIKAADLLPQIELARNVKIDPQLLLQRVAFDIKLEPDRLGHVVFNIEPTTLRPILVEAQIAGQRDVKVVLGYQLAELAFDRTSLKLVETYDIDAQRNEIIDSFSSPIANVDVDGMPVILHKAVIDHDGNLTFIYSGTDTLPYDIDKSQIVDKKMQSEGATLQLMSEINQDGTLHLGAVLHKQTRLALVSVKLNKDQEKVQSIKDVKLPVLRNGVLKWAEFHDVPLMRTGSSLQLIAPENVPWWIKKNTTGAPTKSG